MLVHLECLVLSHNDLSGPIPTEIAVGFQQVDIPDSSYLKHHGMFDLSWNQLSGSIPEELGDYIVIVDLLLNNKNLTGMEPKSLAHLTNLTTLNLSYNNVVGQNS